MRRILRSAWILGGLLFTLWICIGYTALDGAGDAEGGIRGVSTPYGLEFQPNGTAQAASLIFLPGGMVEPEAYSPLLRSVARAGYPAHLIGLPLRLAFTESQVSELFNRIDALLASDPRRNWVVAGHSRGGMLSARFVHQRRPALKGLVLTLTRLFR